MELSRQEALKLLQQMRSGHAPKIFANEMFIGHRDWKVAALKGIEEVAESRGFEVRFIRARYGGGKTHFLRCLEIEAKDRNWVTAHVELKHGKVELDKFHTVVMEIAQNLEMPDGQRGLYALLEKALFHLAQKSGYDSEGAVSLKVFEKAGNAIFSFCTGNHFGFQFSLAFRAGMHAFLSQDTIMLQQICHWLGGAGEVLKIDPAVFSLPGHAATHAAAVNLRPLGSGDAEQLIRVIAILVQECGHMGLLLGLDEVELIAGIKNRLRRENCFQMLRALVDQNDPALEAPSTCLFLAATPLMFEDASMFPSYKALQDRIETLPSLSGQKIINFRAPVINLDQTELNAKELKQIADKIVSVFIAAGGTLPAKFYESVDRLIATISDGNYVIARPRLLCRCMSDLLEGQVVDNVKLSLVRIAKEMEESRKKEVEAS